MDPPPMFFKISKYKTKNEEHSFDYYQKELEWARLHLSINDEIHSGDWVIGKWSFHITRHAKI